MARSDAIVVLENAVERLASEPEVQLAYLRQLGVNDLADELALEFQYAMEDVIPAHSEGFSQLVLSALLDLDRKLDQMSSMPESMWRESAIRSSTEWADVRRGARRLLELMSEVKS